MSTKILFLTLSSSFLILSSCSKTETAAAAASASSAWSASFPNGFAISSPTAPTTTTTASIRTSAISATDTFATKKANIEAIAQATNASTCNVQLPTLTAINSARVECYGPSVPYTNHPDGSPTSGTLPGGDLGIWNKTQDGEACVAAQLNKLIQVSSAFVDMSLSLTASMVCVLNTTSQSVPTAGNTVTITSSFQTAIQQNNSAYTVTSATVAGEANSTYLYTIEGTTDGTKAFSLKMRHHALNTANTQYEGRIWGYFDGTNRDAMSVLYQNVTRLQAQMTAGSWPASTASTTIFSTAGVMDLGGAWQGNMNQAIFNLNPTTGAGLVSYAWQAGANDNKTRVMNAYVSDSNTGCGYFGYGNQFSATASSNTNTISTFICNWAGPGNNHTGVTGKAQKQCFSLSSGKYASTSDNIDYAPVNSCDDPGGSFTYTRPTHSTSQVTNNLVTLSSDSEFTSNYTAPAIPTVSF